VNERPGFGSPSASGPVTATVPAAVARSQADSVRASSVSRHGSAKDQRPSGVRTVPPTTSQLSSYTSPRTWGNR
jgi:hypothetical protein